jgi:hypothetical protein
MNANFLKASVDPEKADAMRQKARFYSGDGDVLCLTSLAQPLVTEMQEVIRFQQNQLEMACGAINHTLGRIAKLPAVRDQLGVCTETFERLTASLADTRDLPVDQVRNDIMPGSASFHRREEAA